MQFRLLGENGRLIRMNTIMRFLRSDAPTGIKIMLISIAPAILGMIPLLLYIIFGPANGNPIGLGLLFVAGIAVSMLGFLLGLLWLLVGHLLNRSRTGQP